MIQASSNTVLSPTRIMAVASSSKKLMRLFSIGNSVTGFFKMIVVIKSMPADSILIRIKCRCVPGNILFQEIQESFNAIGVEIAKEEHIVLAINESIVPEEQRTGPLGIKIGNVPKTFEFLWGLYERFNQKLAMTSTESKTFIQVADKDGYHNVLVAVGFTPNVPSIVSASSKRPDIRFYGRITPGTELFVRIQEAFSKIGVFLPLIDHYFFAINESLVPMELKSPGVSVGNDIPKNLKFLWELGVEQLEYENIHIRNIQEQINHQQINQQQLDQQQREYEVAEFLVSNNRASSVKRSANEEDISSVEQSKDIVSSKVVKRKKKNPKG